MAQRLLRPPPPPGPSPRPAPAASTGAPGVPSPPDRRRRMGLCACLASAVSFGTLPILAKVALDDGANPLGLLWVRFVIAAAVFWVIDATRPARPARRPGDGQVAGLLMGMCGYALEAALFFAALQRIDASLTELLLYAYPAMVTVAALARRTERANPTLIGALLLASAGLVTVFGSSLASGADPAGLALAAGAAAVYAGYVLCGERVVATVAPVRLAALVSTGAAVALTGAAAAGATVHLPGTARGAVALVLVATAATVVPMVTLFAGIARVGAPTASIVSTIEPVVTVILAVTLLGERLGAGELAGATCVVGAVVLLAGAGPRRARPGSSRSPHHDPVDQPDLRTLPAPLRP